MQKERKQNKTQLKSWLLTRPLGFALLCICFGTLFALVYALVQTLFGIESFIPIYVLFTLSFILSAWYMIKKLPHEKMNQSDFVAIANGTNIISIVASFVVIYGVAFRGFFIGRDVMALYLFHPTTFYTLFGISVFVSLYLIGVTISGIYAKYKRAVTLGISPWKVILSMPFAFLMMWTPGYLIKEKENVKPNLEIKSNWYSKFNKWVLANANNTLFMFLILLFIKSLGAGITTMIFSALLLVIYALWYTKYKSNFVKSINDGYAMTVVGINIAVLLAVIAVQII